MKKKKEETKKYKVLLYPKGFADKKSANKEVAKVKKAILGCVQEVSIPELANKVGRKGAPVALCEAEGEGTLSKKHWKGQQIYMLDFDNKDSRTKEKLEYPYYLTPKQAVARSRKKGLTPAFGYRTLSSDKSHERFRLVYVLDEPVTTVEEHEAVYARLSAAFVVKGVRLTDDSCRDLSRIFFGGTSVFGASFSSVLSKEKLAKEGERLLTKPGDTGAETKYNDSDRMLQNIISDIRKIEIGHKIDREDLLSPVFTLVQEEGVNATRQPYIVDIDYKPSRGHQNKSPEPLDFTGFFDKFVQTCVQMPWNRLLGLPKDKLFCCILPDHHDAHPSARFSVYEGKVIYKCFSDNCDKRFDVFEFLKYITNCSFITVCKYLALVFNMKFETDWQTHIGEEIGWYRRMLLSDKYAKTYSVLMKYLDKHKLKGFYMAMLDVANYMLYTGQVAKTDRMMFYISNSLLGKLLSRAGYDKSERTIKRNIKELEHLGLLEAVPDKDIPSKHLARLRAIQKDSGCKYRISCYHIPIDSHTALQGACEAIEFDKANNVLAKARRTREGVLRTFGRETANKMFVQQTKQLVNKKVRRFAEGYRKSIVALLKKNGWTTEKEVLNRMHYLDKKKCKEYSSLCMPELIQEGLIKVVRFSKDVEKEYGINNKKAKLSYGPSKVIIPGGTGIPSQP